MIINDLESYLKVPKFNNFLNEIASYVMYEQSIIKKDNKNDGSSIKYRYDAKSFGYINYFISKIEFLSEPVIGSAKKVIIKDLPDSYKYSSKHEISIEEKIYILDKIKDTFMHLHNNETMYEFDEKNIIIKNKGADYSLECRIPFEALYVFNRCIKYVYDDSTPSLDWIDDFLVKKNKNTYRMYKIKNSNYDLYEIKLSSQKRVVYDPGSGFYQFYERDNIENLNGKSNSISIMEYDSYHTISYISLLKASSEDMNYPLIESLYDFDFHCEHSAYVDKVKMIMKEIIEFYDYISFNIGKIDENKLKIKILEFLFSVGQNGKEKGLISDISSVNNMIIKKYMRNARSHANNKGVENSSIENEKIIYHDVLYNSLKNPISKKSIPTFTLIGKRKDLNIFFGEIRTCSINNKELYEQIVNELNLGKNDSLELFLQQLSKFINQCSKDNILYANSLKTPIGNSTDFVDFIRKIMNGTFEYEEVKEVKRKM